jgi:hypothetical protein
MARGNAGEAVVAPGMVVVALSELGQVVSVPTGTSENWYVNWAADDGANGTDDGAPLACGDTLTDSPFTMVTVTDAPVPTKSAMVG